MSPIDAAARVLKPVGEREKSQTGRIIQLNEKDFSRGRKQEVDSAVQEKRKIENEPFVGDASHHDERVIPKKPLYYRFIKRLFDVVFSICVIVVGFVPALILSIFIVKDTGGSPIYSSTRVGRNGKLFKIFKFRSMVADSDNLEKYFSPEQLEQWCQEHKVDDDPRITKLGAFLRSSSIDELPQFVNVLLGQISVIGPRAITKEELAFFGSDQKLLLSCPPGITGLWQTGERNLATFESGLRQQLELLYVQNASLGLDARLFFRTFRVMLERTGR